MKNQNPSIVKGRGSSASSGKGKGKDNNVPKIPQLPPSIPPDESEVDALSQQLFMRTATLRAYPSVENWFRQKAAAFDTEIEEKMAALKGYEAKEIPSTFEEVQKIRERRRISRETMKEKLERAYVCAAYEERMGNAWLQHYAKHGRQYLAQLEVMEEELLMRRRKAEEWTVHGERERVMVKMKRFQEKYNLLLVRMEEDVAHLEHEAEREAERMRIAFEACLEEIRDVVSWHVLQQSRGVQGRVSAARREQLLSVLGDNPGYLLHKANAKAARRQRLLQQQPMLPSSNMHSQLDSTLSSRTADFLNNADQVATSEISDEEGEDDDDDDDDLSTIPSTEMGPMFAPTAEDQMFHDEEHRLKRLLRQKVRRRETRHTKLEQQRQAETHTLKELFRRAQEEEREALRQHQRNQYMRHSSADNGAPQNHQMSTYNRTNPYPGDDAGGSETVGRYSSGGYSRGEGSAPSISSSASTTSSDFDYFKERSPNTDLPHTPAPDMQRGDSGDLLFEGHPPSSSRRTSRATASNPNEGKGKKQKTQHRVSQSRPPRQQAAGGGAHHTSSQPHPPPPPPPPLGGAHPDQHRSNERAGASYHHHHQSYSNSAGLVSVQPIDSSRSRLSTGTKPPSSSLTKLAGATGGNHSARGGGAGFASSPGASSTSVPRNSPRFGSPSASIRQNMNASSGSAGLHVPHRGGRGGLIAGNDSNSTVSPSIGAGGSTAHSPDPYVLPPSRSLQTLEGLSVPEPPAVLAAAAALQSAGSGSRYQHNAGGGGTPGRKTVGYASNVVTPRGGGGGGGGSPSVGTSLPSIHVANGGGSPGRGSPLSHKSTTVSRNGTGSGGGGGGANSLRVGGKKKSNPNPPSVSATGSPRQVSPRTTNDTPTTILPSIPQGGGVSHFQAASSPSPGSRKSSTGGGGNQTMAGAQAESGADTTAVVPSRSAAPSTKEVSKETSSHLTMSKAGGGGGVGTGTATVRTSTSASGSRKMSLSHATGAGAAGTAGTSQFPPHPVTSGEDSGESASGGGGGLGGLGVDGGGSTGMLVGEVSLTVSSQKDGGVTGEGKLKKKVKKMMQVLVKKRRPKNGGDSTTTANNEKDDVEEIQDCPLPLPEVVQSDALGSTNGGNSSSSAGAQSASNSSVGEVAQASVQTAVPQGAATSTVSGKMAGSGEGAPTSSAGGEELPPSAPPQTKEEEKPKDHPDGGEGEGGDGTDEAAGKDSDSWEEYEEWEEVEVEVEEDEEERESGGGLLSTTTTSTTPVPPKKTPEKRGYVNGKLFRHRRVVKEIVMPPASGGPNGALIPTEHFNQLVFSLSNETEETRQLLERTTSQSTSLLNRLQQLKTACDRLLMDNVRLERDKDALREELRQQAEQRVQVEDAAEFCRMREEFDCAILREEQQDVVEDLNELLRLKQAELRSTRMQIDEVSTKIKDHDTLLTRVQSYWRNNSSYLRRACGDVSSANPFDSRNTSRNLYSSTKPPGLSNPLYQSSQDEGSMIGPLPFGTSGNHGAHSSTSQLQTSLHSIQGGIPLAPSTATTDAESGAPPDSVPETARPANLPNPTEEIKGGGSESITGVLGANSMSNNMNSTSTNNNNVRASADTSATSLNRRFFSSPLRPGNSVTGAASSKNSPSLSPSPLDAASTSAQGAASPYPATAPSSSSPGESTSILLAGSPRDLEEYSDGVTPIHLLQLRQMDEIAEFIHSVFEV